MDKGIKLQKELAMGSKNSTREAVGKVRAPTKNVKAFKCGGSVKKGKK